VIAGDYDAATEWLERAWELEPNLPYVTRMLALAYHLRGDGAAALEAFVRGTPAEHAAAARTGHEQSGWPGQVRASLDWRVARSGKPCTDDPILGASDLAQVGETDRMFECLHEAVSRRGFLDLKVHPSFAPYRDDPRFTALLRRMGLEE
jgi:hypothetical protein